MLFTKRLREGIRRGRIRCSIRIWTRPHVKAGGRYSMDDGHIVVDSMTRISASDITYDLARESGFESVEDVLQIAGIGNNLMLPPPLWFWVASLAALIPASYVGARLVPERSSVTAASARI